MTQAPAPRPHPAALPWRPPQRQLRWASGLVLLAYVALHLLDHALGLVSLGVAERTLARVHGFWHHPVGTLALYGAACVHVLLAFAGLWERRTLRMPAIETLRLALGFVLPVLLAAHLASMRWAYEAYGLDPDYTRVVRGLWRPGAATFQMATMAAAWAHGCLGLHLALRARTVWQRMFPAFLCGA